MPKRSAGLLLYRLTSGRLEVFLVHPGGPFWAKKDEGAWSIPKGEIAEGEEPLAAGRREFQEETGFCPTGEAVFLGTFRQPSGKHVTAFAIEGDLDPAAVISNTFTMQWPPRSGRMRAFPEVDRAGWFSREEAECKLLRGQLPILEALSKRLQQVADQGH